MFNPVTGGYKCSCTFFGAATHSVVVACYFIIVLSDISVAIAVYVNSERKDGTVLCIVISAYILDSLHKVLPGMSTGGRADYYS